MSDFGMAGITENYLHHGFLDEFLDAVDEKCFVCWRTFRNSFTHPAHARKLLGKIAKVVCNEKREDERKYLSVKRRHVTGIWAGSKLSHDRFWAEWNNDFLETLKVAHEDLDWLRPDIEDLERPVKREFKDENGRKGGSFLFVPRDPYCECVPGLAC